MNSFTLPRTLYTKEFKVTNGVKATAEQSSGPERPSQRSIRKDWPFACQGGMINSIRNKAGSLLVCLGLNKYRVSFGLSCSGFVLLVLS